MSDRAYQLVMPRRRKTSVVFASPHSGKAYDPAFVASSALNAHEIRSSEDAFVDLLFGSAPRFGAPLLAAMAPRAFVDLNRNADELDFALIRGVAKTSSNPRISSGLGVIPRVVANGRAIYQGKISRDEADTRLRDIWHPYHDRLQSLLDESHDLFGEAILIDCHSMPHEAISAVNHSHLRRPDVVLGDRYGAAAGARVVERIEAALTSAGLSVVRNSPFAGAHIAKHYGRPSLGRHVVQIEIDRSLYMDEKNIRPNADFDELKAVITQVIAEITKFERGNLRMAAE